MNASNEPDRLNVPDSFTDEVTGDGVFRVVLDSYEAMYDALPAGELFNSIWRTNAYYSEFPIEFAHFGFLTLAEGKRMLDLLRVAPNGVLIDLACGAGGPGLWAAQRTGASLIGIDPTASGVAAATKRAISTGLAERSRFQRGTFVHTGLPDGSANSVMCVEAFQYAPDKRAALAEIFRILRRRGRMAFIGFEVDPAKAAGIPVLGVDPIADYRSVIEGAGFVIDAYEETPGWEDRVYGVFTAIIEASDALTAEIGSRAAAGALAEAMITIQMKPYPRRVLAVAQKPRGSA